MIRRAILSTTLLISAGIANAQSNVASTYTSVDPNDCLIINSSENSEEPEIDFLNSECPGMAGYRVFVSGGDLRYSVRLEYNGKEIDLPTPGAFHDVGSSKIEWRYSKFGEGYDRFVSFRSLIFRINRAIFDANQDVSELYVVRLDGESSCLVGVVPPSADMNLKARQIADSQEGRACIQQL